MASSRDSYARCAFSLSLTRLIKLSKIGTARQVADRILLFRSLGIDLVLTAFLHFIEEVEQFGKEVIPLVRQGEAEGRGLDAEKEIAISGHIYDP